MTNEKLKAQLEEAFDRLNLEPRNIEIFIDYLNTLASWNKKINLVSRKENNIVTNLVASSLVFFNLTNNMNIQSIADLGSGAGFPALIIKIYNPSIDVVMIEKNRKKAAFLRYVSSKLNLKCKVIEKDIINIKENEIKQTDAVTVRGISITEEMTDLLKRKTKSSYLAYFTSPNIRLPLVLIKEIQFNSISSQLYKL